MGKSQEGNVKKQEVTKDKVPNFIEVLDKGV